MSSFQILIDTLGLFSVKVLQPKASESYICATKFEATNEIWFHELVLTKYLTMKCILSICRYFHVKAKFNSENRTSTTNTKNRINNIDIIMK